MLADASTVGSDTALLKLGLIKTAGPLDFIKQMRAARAAKLKELTPESPDLVSRIRNTIEADPTVNLKTEGNTLWEKVINKAGGGAYNPVESVTPQGAKYLDVPTDRPTVSLTKEDPFIAAHEYGHHKFNQGRVGGFLGKPVFDRLYRASPLFGLYAGNVAGHLNPIRGEFNVPAAIKASLVGPALAAPRLIHESAANVKALKHLYEEGASKKDVLPIAGSLARNIGSYTANAAAAPGAIYLSHKLRQAGGIPGILRALERRRLAKKYDIPL